MGQGNWQQQIDANKTAFTEEFVQRSGFLSMFPLSMTAGAFVDRLNTNARGQNDVVPLSQTERDNLATMLTNGTMTRTAKMRTAICRCGQSRR